MTTSTKHLWASAAAMALLGLVPGAAAAETKLKWAHVYESSEPYHTCAVAAHDLLMAANAGCASVGVSYGAHAPDAFGELNPRFIAHSVPELHAWLIDNA